MLCTLDLNSRRTWKSKGLLLEFLSLYAHFTPATTSLLIRSSPSPQGDMTFNDFLDMFSVFSEAAAKEVKAEYAFKIYDFDGDGELGRQDLLTTARTLSGGELEESEMKLIVDKVMEEVDDDMDGTVSLAEFQQIVQRAADFTTQFHIRI